MNAALDETAWFPVGRSDDAPRRSVHQAKLLGRELVVWRADDDVVNVWANRCLHRGVRLSVGRNEGHELTCLYHGWRYASRTGGCTYIPAHPADAPAQTICNTTYPVRERFGLIWTSIAGTGDPPAIDGLEDAFPLRSLPVTAPPAMVRDQLEEYEQHDDESVVFFVQPVDSFECTVHSVLGHPPAPEDAIGVLRRHARELARVRDAIEARAAAEPAPAPLEPALERVGPSVTAVAPPQGRGDAGLRVVVARKWSAATDVVALELEGLDNDLPAPQPGSHIDVHLPNGLVRQYSLTNRSGTGPAYVIGVKREPESRGGSACIHDTVREGDVLAISAPRNSFTLRRDADETVLIAGGIGITPLLSMAETLRSDGKRSTLHHFVRSRDHIPFGDRLAALGDDVVHHIGLSPDETATGLAEILEHPRDGRQVYICGPGPMLDAARAAAATAGWPDDTVHFEYFRNDTEIDDSTSFTIELARSGVTASVAPGRTILDVLRAEGVPMPSSCEQGACGTCLVPVLDGEPAHQDVYLNASERAANDRIVTCVSRATTDRLILDI